jgi:hypothetical protein
MGHGMGIPVYLYPAKYLVGRAHLYPATGVAGYKSGLPSKIITACNML